MGCTNSKPADTDTPNTNDDAAAGGDLSRTTSVVVVSPTTKRNTATPNSARTSGSIKNGTLSLRSSMKKKKVLPTDTINETTGVDSTRLLQPSAISLHTKNQGSNSTLQAPITPTAPADQPTTSPTLQSWHSGTQGPRKSILRTEGSHRHLHKASISINNTNNRRKDSSVDFGNATVTTIDPQMLTVTNATTPGGSRDSSLPNTPRNGETKSRKNSDKNGSAINSVAGPNGTIDEVPAAVRSVRDRKSTRSHTRARSVDVPDLAAKEQQSTTPNHTLSPPSHHAAASLDSIAPFPNGASVVMSHRVPGRNARKDHQRNGSKQEKPPGTSRRGSRLVRRTSFRGMMSALALKFPLIRASFLAVHRVFRQYHLERERHSQSLSHAIQTVNAEIKATGDAKRASYQLQSTNNKPHQIASKPPAKRRARRFDGESIRLDQLADVLRAITTHKPTEWTDDEVKQLFSIADLDGSKTITFREFLIVIAVGYYLKVQSDSPEFLQIQQGFRVVENAFKDMDSDKSGTVDVTELKNALFAVYDDSNNRVDSSPQSHDTDDKENNNTLQSPSNAQNSTQIHPTPSPPNSLFRTTTSSKMSNTNQHILDERFRELDFNHDGGVEFPEFVWCISAWVGCDALDEELDNECNDEAAAVVLENTAKNTTTRQGTLTDAMQSLIASLRSDKRTSL